MKLIQKASSFFIVLFIFILVSCPTHLLAQIDPGCQPCFRGDCGLAGCKIDGMGNEICCPIDSSVWILLAFGVLYGVFTIYRIKFRKAGI